MKSALGTLKRGKRIKGIWSIKISISSTLSQLYGVLKFNLGDERNKKTYGD